MQPTDGHRASGWASSDWVMSTPKADDGGQYTAGLSREGEQEPLERRDHTLGEERVTGSRREGVLSVGVCRARQRVIQSQ